MFKKLFNNLFKKLFKKICFTLAFLLLALPAFAIDIQEEGVSLGEITHINVIGDRVTATNEAGGVATLTFSGNEEVIQFTTDDFILVDHTSTGITELDTTSQPGLAINNKLTSIVWADDEVTPVQVTFKVPADYSSGGAFRGLFDVSSTTTTNVDFQVWITVPGGNTWDSTATNQTAVALAAVESSPELVTLTPNATADALIVAGSLISVEVWRDNTDPDGDANLEMYYLEFYYLNN